MRAEKPGACTVRLTNEDSADDEDLLSHTDVPIEAGLQVLPVVALPSDWRSKRPETPSAGSDPAEVDDAVHGHLLVWRPG
mgnify:CR=1 FL=1